ncbi:MAG: Rieske 2Fe-2S domain-containing protein, partial [Arenibacterium sp.]
MISQELNDSLTRVGPGSDAGEVLRRYWPPAALSDEFAGARPGAPGDLLGERFVPFRDTSGDLGPIQRHCPHRGAGLCYGRPEDNGPGGPFYGWDFDRRGH